MNNIYFMIKIKIKYVVPLIYMLLNMIPGKIINKTVKILAYAGIAKPSAKLG